MFDRTEAQAIMDKAKTALEKILGDSVVVNRTRASFSELEMKLSFTLGTTSDGTSEGETQQERDWHLYAENFGLMDKWVGCTVTFPNGHTCEIVGLNTRKRKNKVMLVDVDTNEPRMCTPTAARNCIERFTQERAARKVEREARKAEKVG